MVNKTVSYLKLGFMGESFELMVSGRRAKISLNWKKCYLFFFLWFVPCIFSTFFVQRNSSLISYSEGGERICLCCEYLYFVCLRIIHYFWSRFNKTFYKCPCKSVTHWRLWVIIYWIIWNVKYCGFRILKQIKVDCLFGTLLRGFMTSPFFTLWFYFKIK